MSDPQETAAPPLSLLSPDGSGEIIARHWLQLPLNLRFKFNGYAFRAKAYQSKKGPMLALEGNLGSVPYSVESPSARQETFRVLQSAPAGTQCQLSLEQRLRIRVLGETEIRGWPKPENLLVAITQLLMDAEPTMEKVAGAVGNGRRRTARKFKAAR